MSQHHAWPSAFQTRYLGLVSPSFIRTLYPQHHIPALCPSAVPQHYTPALYLLAYVFFAISRYFSIAEISEISLRRLVLSIGML